MEHRIKDIEQADTAYLCFLFRKFKLQLNSFVRYCLRHDLRPKFIKCKLYSDSPFITGKLTKWLVAKWLRCELHQWYGRQNVTNRLRMMVHLRLAAELSPQDFDKVTQEIEEESSVHRETLLHTKN